MSSSNFTYLVTGVNRGIGRGLLATYLLRPSTTVVAAVRNLSHPSSKSLHDIPTDTTSKLVLVKIDASSNTDAAAAIATLKQEHNIHHLDVVIANAGVATDYSSVEAVDPNVVQQFIEVNGLGALYLFQAVLPLLRKASSDKGKFIGIGNPIGSIGGMQLRPYPQAAYGPSKSVLHWLVRKIHFEHDELISFVVDPGFVRTDMGNAGARAFGLAEAFTLVVGSVAGIVAVIDSATKEETSGHFAGWAGEEFPW